MAIFKPPVGETVVEPMQVEPIAEEVFEQEVVDSKFAPASALLTHVSGSNWTVNYYNQYLSETSVGTEQQTSQDPVHQQYLNIDGLNIKVIAPLTSQQNQESGEFEVTGEANISPPMTPIVGDMFIGDIGDGRTGVFAINSITRKSMFKDSVFEVKYTLQDYLTEERKTDLDSKTVKTIEYRSDFLLEGLNPFLVPEEHVQVDQLKEYAGEIIDMHYQEFYSTEYSTLVAPGELSTYDPHFIDTYNKIISNDELGNKKRPVVLECAPGDGILPSTVYDSLLRLDDSLLYLSSNRVRLANSSEFLTTPTFGSVALSGIRKVVWGMYELTHREKLSHRTTEALVAADTIETDVDYPGAETIDAYPIDIDKYYVFSKPFYNGESEGMSKIELEVVKCFKGEALSVSTLLELLEDLPSWSPSQRFYLIPVLLILIRVALREV